MFSKKDKDLKSLFSKKDKDVRALLKKTQRAKKRQERIEYIANLTPEQQAKRSFIITAGSFGVATVLFAIINFVSIGTFTPTNISSDDSIRLDNVKTFISTENADKYEEIIARHNDEAKNDKLDIKTVYSSTGRDHPFSMILNKSDSNNSTKLCKFIYSELKPALTSYYLANGVYPVNAGEHTEYGYKIDLTLIDDLLNYRDSALSSYTYYLNGTPSESNLYVTVKDGENVIPIVLFDPTQFVIKEINSNEVSLVHGKYTIILKVMEEFNNIRLKEINISPTSKNCVVVDTITNKVVKINAK